MTQQPTNCTVSIKRNGQTVTGLTALPCLVLPEDRPEILDRYGVPAGEGFRFSFPQLYSSIRAGDQIVLDSNPNSVTASVKITGISHVPSPKLPHTSGMAQGNWGTS